MGAEDRIGWGGVRGETAGTRPQKSEILEFGKEDRFCIYFNPNIKVGSFNDFLETSLTNFQSVYLFNSLTQNKAFFIKVFLKDLYGIVQ